MEVESSPLAAQSPAFRHTSAFLGDMTRPSPSKNMGGNLFGPKLAVKFETQDTYYEDSRMSSPTTSLVADLSQNFHIDKMSVFSTPLSPVQLFGEFGIFFHCTNGGILFRKQASNPDPAPFSVHLIGYERGL